MVTLYYEKDANATLLNNKKIAVIGYGSQGRAQARMLHESGLNVVVGVRSNGASWTQVQADGLEVAAIAEAVAEADIVHILIPDEIQAEVYESEIEPNLKTDATLSFSHGFNVVFGKIKPAQNLDVIMVAPKSPGTEEYKRYKEGFGVPALIAIHQDASGEAKATALALADAMKFTKAGVMECTFQQEAEEDLFGEQTVLCGGAAGLIKAGFEVLTEAGYPPEMAYFECLHEMKLIVDLMYEGGIGHMYHVVSNTAEYGGRSFESKINNEEMKNVMRAQLKHIQSGGFAEEWLNEYKTGMQNMTKWREAEKNHPIEVVGAEIRKLFEKK